MATHAVSTGERPGWKQKLAHELTEFWIIFLYLIFFLGVFAWYRRLILAEYEISYLHYGIAVIEALVLAKVILIADALHLGRGLEEKPLIVPTFYKTVVFTLFVMAFKLIEHTTVRMVHGNSLAASLSDVFSNENEWLASSLVTFAAFIPFFAFKELGRVLGEQKIRELFFYRKPGTAPERSDKQH